MIILSIDSGIERTGYAFFDRDKKHENGLRYINSGLVQTSKALKKETRLEEIYKNFEALIKKMKPELMVMEQLFFFKNVKTAISVAQAQGILLLLASQQKLPVHFLTPLQIKQIITGYGQSDKKSVQKMLRMTLHLTEELQQDDVADAIACGAAFCYLNRLI